MKQTAILLLIAATAACGQKALLRPDIPALLDPKLPSLYLRFDHVGKHAPVHSGESGEWVWLRLRNNTNAAIGIRTESLYVGPKVSPLTLKNGETVLGMRDGTEVSACYRVEQRRPRSSTSRAKGAVEVDQIAEYQLLSPATCGDFGANSWIPGGSFVLISLPREQLDAKNRISISFRYEWEPVSPDVEHRAFFYASELPEQIGTGKVESSR